MTFAEFAPPFISPNMWYIIIATLLIVAFLAMRFIFKQIKWGIMLLLLAILIFISYGWLFNRTFEGGPEELRAPKVEQNARGIYDELQSRALRILKTNTK